MRNATLTLTTLCLATALLDAGCAADLESSEDEVQEVAAIEQALTGSVTFDIDAPDYEIQALHDPDDDCDFQSDQSCPVFYAEVGFDRGRAYISVGNQRLDARTRISSIALTVQCRQRWTTHNGIETKSFGSATIPYNGWKYYASGSTLCGGSGTMDWATVVVRYSVD